MNESFLPGCLIGHACVRQPPSFWSIHHSGYFMMPSLIFSAKVIAPVKTSTPTHPVFQDMPEVAQMKSVFPFCKSAKVGNIFYPVIASNKLMESITDDVNFVSAVRKVKSNAFNPSGFEHGITKKACDMLIDNPSSFIPETMTDCIIIVSTIFSTVFL